MAIGLIGGIIGKAVFSSVASGLVSKVVNVASESVGKPSQIGNLLGKGDSTSKGGGLLGGLIPSPLDLLKGLFGGVGYAKSKSPLSLAGGLGKLLSFTGGDEKANQAAEKTEQMLAVVEGLKRSPASVGSGVVSNLYV